MRTLEEFLKPTQKQLFNKLCLMFGKKAITKNEAYILVRGEAPTMLVAHMDTVHKEPVKYICTSSDGNIVMSPQGIGGDDRCGVFALVNAYDNSETKPWLLFTCDEEVGGIGASKFCDAYAKGKLPKEIDSLKMIIEIDRKGSKDAVYYDCDNDEFEKYITSKGFDTEYGSFSDISYIAPELGVAAVNLSSGYYNAHHTHEYINKKHLNMTIQKVIEIVSETCAEDFPKYEYRAKVYVCPDFTYHGYDRFSSFTKPCLRRRAAESFAANGLPPEYLDMYDELLDYYSEHKLDCQIMKFGYEAIIELYENIFGPLIPEDEDESHIDEVKNVAGFKLNWR